MYDNICKFIAETFPGDMASWLLGQSVTLTQLDPKELLVEPIRADSVILLQSEQLILHIEFQTEPDAEIPFRMADYYLRLYRRYPDKQVRQVVLYLKETGSARVQIASFSLAKLSHEFEVIRLWEQPTRLFMGTPGLLPFAVLSQTQNREQILRGVAQQMQSIANMKLRSQVEAAAGILAGLVLSEGVINQVLGQDTMKESVIYQSILSKGKAEGKAEGKVEEGRSLVLKQLTRRLGRVPSEVVSQVEALSLEEVEALGEALLDFSSLSDLQAWFQN